ALDAEMAGLGRGLAELDRTRALWADQLAERKVAVHSLETAAREAETAVQGADHALAEAERRLEECREELQTLNEESHRLELEQAVKEIDQTARAMFLETFTAVRANFHTVFRTLFEGGECDVRLADENDPLGSEIEIQAAPRGKRTQRIHLLSSGERALVAISLLFCIYLTEP